MLKSLPAYDNKVELANKFCIFSLKVLKFLGRIVLGNLNIIVHFTGKGPECSYFEDILKLEILLYVCSFYKTIIYIVDKLSP